MSEAYYGRSYADAPEIDGKIYFSSGRKLLEGEFVNVKINDILDYDPVSYTHLLARLADEMTRDIEKDVVDFCNNFDNKRKEPTVLPSRIPNLLVNGSMGIAVGMATNIPPHNLCEVIDGTIFLMENPNATVSDLMNYIDVYKRQLLLYFYLILFELKSY